MKIPLFRNTATNYLSLAVRMAEGILVVRWMVGSLGKEIYGLWGILWSFFAYAVLVDFGFGTAARKYTAQRLQQSDPKRYNELISTVLTSYLLASLPIALGGWYASRHAQLLFHLAPDQSGLIALCSRALICFAVGTAAIFPTTLFNALLVGLQRLYLRNLVDMAAKVVEFGGVILIFHLGLAPGDALLALILHVLAVQLLANLTMGFCARRHLPGWHLSIGLKRQALREVFAFSWWIWFGSVARLLRNNFSPILVGGLCGLSLSGSYQIGRRLPQLMCQLTLPYQENAGPLAARLHARGKRTALAQVLLGFLRWNVLLSTGISAILFTLAPNLIRLLFGVDDPQSTLVCRLLTLTIWVGLSMRSVPQCVFLMAEKHRQEILLGIVESTVALGLTVVLLQRFPGVLACVPAVDLGVNLAACLLVVLPLLRNLAGIPCTRIILDAFLKPIFAATPCALAAAGVRSLLEGWCALPLILIIAASAACGAIAYALAAWRLLVTPAERRRACRRISRFLSTSDTR